MLLPVTFTLFNERVSAATFECVVVLRFEGDSQLMGLLNLLDLAVIVFYLSGITIVCARFDRKNTNIQEYLLGNKGMNWLPVALSILAADTSAVSYLGVPAWSFQENMRLNQNIFTYLLAIPIVIWLFLP